MKNIEIGKTFSASAVSLGCMRMASLDEKKIDVIMSTALECGIDFFDHADIYGGGRMRKAIRGIFKEEQIPQG